MKKLLLLFGLVASLQAANAQAFKQYNVNGNTQQEITSSISVVTDKVAWMAYRSNKVAMTADGTTWNVYTINGANGYSISNIFGLDAKTALVAMYKTSGGGAIFKTEDGGINWKKVSTSAMFAAPGGFPNDVHFYDANNGVAMGDPNKGKFEVWTTADGGTTWQETPAANIPAPLESEYGTVNYYTGNKNTVWFIGTQIDLTTNPQSPLPGNRRLFRSTDKGKNWTVSPLPVPNENDIRIAFKDDNNGLIVSVGNVNFYQPLFKTADGGKTWNQVRQTGTTPYFFQGIGDLAAAPGGNFYYAGVAIADTSDPNSQLYLYTAKSADGDKWSGFDSTAQIIDMGFIYNNVGFAGGVTDSVGMGGAYRLYQTAAAISPLAYKAGSLYPNPSVDGNLNLKLDRTGIITVNIIDATGKNVFNKTYNTSSLNQQIDIANLPKGLYMLNVDGAVSLHEKLIKE